MALAVGEAVDVGCMVASCSGVEVAVEVRMGTRTGVMGVVVWHPTNARIIKQAEGITVIRLGIDSQRFISM